MDGDTPLLRELQALRAELAVMRAQREADAIAARIASALAVLRADTDKLREEVSRLCGRPQERRGADE